MKLIGCGGRYLTFSPDHPPTQFIWTWVASALRHLKVTEVIDGGMSGADSSFHHLAETLGIDSTRFYANWKRYGTNAGPRRNAKQLAYLQQSATMAKEACAILALPGGRGTENMIRQGLMHHIQVWAPTMEELRLLTPDVYFSTNQHKDMRPSQEKEPS